MLECAQKINPAPYSEFVPRRLGSASASHGRVNVGIGRGLESAEDLAGCGIHRNDFRNRDLKVSNHHSGDVGCYVSVRRIELSALRNIASNVSTLHDRLCFTMVQYSTLTKYNPLAGAVAPAADRSRAARIWVRFSGFNVPFPTSTNVPTKFLTMWCKNPLPRTV